MSKDENVNEEELDQRNDEQVEEKVELTPEEEAIAKYNEVNAVMFCGYLFAGVRQLLRRRRGLAVHVYLHERLARVLTLHQTGSSSDPVSDLLEF